LDNVEEEFMTGSLIWKVHSGKLEKREMAAMNETTMEHSGEPIHPTGVLCSKWYARLIQAYNARQVEKRNGKKLQSSCNSGKRQAPKGIYLKNEQYDLSKLWYCVSSWIRNKIAFNRL
jgi:hypothetical protein